MAPPRHRAAALRPAAPTYDLLVATLRSARCPAWDCTLTVYATEAIRPGHHQTGIQNVPTRFSDYADSSDFIETSHHLILHSSKMTDLQLIRYPKQVAARCHGASSTATGRASRQTLGHVFQTAMRIVAIGVWLVVPPYRAHWQASDPKTPVSVAERSDLHQDCRRGAVVLIPTLIKRRDKIPAVALLGN
jgi:hypothetical protein